LAFLEKGDDGRQSTDDRRPIAFISFSGIDSRVLVVYFDRKAIVYQLKAMPNQPNTLQV
jgi:hypothetical protein